MAGMKAKQLENTAEKSVKKTLENIDFCKTVKITKFNHWLM